MDLNPLYCRWRLIVTALCVVVVAHIVLGPGGSRCSDRYCHYRGKCEVITVSEEENNQSSVPQRTKQECSCQDGYLGVRCEHKTCLSDPAECGSPQMRCANGMCVCLPGRTGVNCESEIEADTDLEPGDGNDYSFNDYEYFDDIEDEDGDEDDGDDTNDESYDYDDSSDGDGDSAGIYDENDEDSTGSDEEDDDTDEQQDSESDDDGDETDRIEDHKNQPKVSNGLNPGAIVVIVIAVCIICATLVFAAYKGNSRMCPRESRQQRPVPLSNADTPHSDQADPLSAHGHPLSAHGHPLSAHGHPLSAHEDLRGPPPSYDHAVANPPPSIQASLQQPQVTVNVTSASVIFQQVLTPPVDFGQQNIDEGLQPSTSSTVRSSVTGEERKTTDNHQQTSALDGKQKSAETDKVLPPIDGNQSSACSQSAITKDQGRNDNFASYVKQKREGTDKVQVSIGGNKSSEVRKPNGLTPDEAIAKVKPIKSILENLLEDTEELERSCNTATVSQRDYTKVKEAKNGNIANNKGGHDLDVS